MIHDRIPTIGEHRGVPLHDHQSPARLSIVKAQIDDVHAMDDVDELNAFALCIANAPEARQLACWKVAALWETAADERKRRPEGIDLRYLRGVSMALGSRQWRSKNFFGTALEGGFLGPEGAAKRETPLDHGI